MIKVYEALQRAHVERQLAISAGHAAHTEIMAPEIPRNNTFPRLKMASEMRRLHQNVIALLPRSQKGIIQFISSRKGEGTSTIVREFALFLLHHRNNSVLIVESGSKNSAQHQAFGIRPRKSMPCTVQNGVCIDEYISQVGDSQGYLCWLSEEAVSMARPKHLAEQPVIWNTLRASYDFVLLDCQPISDQDAALNLCVETDGVVLVLEAEKTRSRVVSNLRNRIVQNGGKVLGLVFNKQKYYIPDWIYKHL